MANAADFVEDSTSEPAGRLLRAKGQLLRDRINALGRQLEGHRIVTDGLAKERSSLAQEVDIYANEVDRLLEANRTLRLQAAALALQKERAEKQVRAYAAALTQAGLPLPPEDAE